MVTYIHFNGPGPNTLGGNTAACIRQSTIANSANSTTPAASSPAVATMLCGIWATLTANAAAPISTSDHTGTLGAGVSAPGWARPAVSAIGTSIAISPVRIAIATNAHRHKPNCANRPPVAGPTTVATPHIADTSAEARVHSERGSAALMTA